MKKKIIMAVIIASMVVSSGATAFAADSVNSKNTNSICNSKIKLNEFQNKLDALVTNGTLSLNGANSIKDALRPKSIKNGNLKNHEKLVTMIKDKLDALVENKTLTEDEKNAINSAITNSNKNFKNLFNDLIANGTLNSDKVHLIKETLKPNSIKDKHFKNPEKHMDMIKNTLDTLVKNKTLTENEKTTVINILDFSD